MQTGSLISFLFLFVLLVQFHRPVLILIIAGNVHEC